MSFKGGDIRQITWNNNTVGTGVFETQSGEDFVIERGGFRSEDDTSMVSSGGQMIDKQNRKRWKVTGPILYNSQVNNEQRTLSQLAAATEDTTFTFTLRDGTVLVGVGRPVGDFEASAQDSSVPVTFSGGGILEEI